jgi:hypothetical protein
VPGRQVEEIVEEIIEEITKQTKGEEAILTLFVFNTGSANFAISL